MQKKNEENLIAYIAELEARLQTTEKYINTLAELNNLKLPTNADLQKELTSQRSKADKKYQPLKS